MNNSIKLTIIKILKDTIDKIENDECSLDDEEILSIAKNLVHIKLNIEQTCNYIHVYGSLILSETKQGLQTEIESIIQTRKQALDNIEQYKKDIVDGENILKKLNPQFAKDKARDDQISTLNNKVSNMEDTLNKIVTMLSDSTKH